MEYEKDESNDDKVKDNRNRESRQVFTDKEKEKLLMFTNQPYSLMCEIYLRKYLPEIFL